MEEWRKVRKTKEVKHVIESPDEVEEQFDDDYIFEINGKSLVIHQKNVGLIDSEEHLGAVGRIVWDAVSEQIYFLHLRIKERSLIEIP